MNGCRPLTNEEVNLISSSFDNIRDKALFVFSVYTGFRIQESLSLKVCDVYENEALKDRITVFKRNMKGKSSSRSVMLHDEVKKVLNQHIIASQLKTTDYLFKSGKGDNKPISRIQAWRILNQIVKKTGLTGKIALHSTRKVFAEKMYKAFDKDLVKTSKALGHKHITSTVSYLSFKTEELDKAIENIEFK